MIKDYMINIIIICLKTLRDNDVITQPDLKEIMDLIYKKTR